MKKHAHMNKIVEEHYLEIYTGETPKRLLITMRTLNCSETSVACLMREGNCSENLE